MTKKITIDEVARLAYVSRSVVSRVLNNHPNVSKEARARVMKVIEEYNYRPSSVARSLVTDRTYELCVLAPRRRNDVLATGYWPLVLLGLSEQSIQRGYYVSISMVSADMESAINERILTGHAFDGFILIARDVTRFVAEALQASATPIVLIGHDPNFPDLNSIDADNFDGAYQAGSHLVGLGYRRIGLMLGPAEMPESDDRRNGFLKALADAGLSVPPAYTAIGDYSHQSGYAIMQRWIERGDVPEAVFCTSDAKATGAILALHEAGLRVPEDVAIVGFDDLPTARFTIPPLTTVHQPVYEKGEQAANVIIDLIEGQRTGVIHQNLPVKLVVRETCGAHLRTT
ncbi:LacI family transcriptional regulator [Rhodocaloribacter litoris]|uniref:LacI family DNA-binding transcriptional regulator n=1 Tax=Rhodocaloribacter litoris TaxID=2558931 RepID=UPI001421F894|nr:LacI family DNA-binding transcriptional regulator [Rhodocaloribacter litoris]QXD16315.1 LacI family transcriptional regulator [Rhodocaloribacter litoris]